LKTELIIDDFGERLNDAQIVEQVKALRK